MTGHRWFSLAGHSFGSDAIRMQLERMHNGIWELRSSSSVREIVCTSAYLYPLLGAGLWGQENKESSLWYVACCYRTRLSTLSLAPVVNHKSVSEVVARRGNSHRAGLKVVPFHNLDNLRPSFPSIFVCIIIFLKSS